MLSAAATRLEKALLGVRYATDRPHRLTPQVAARALEVLWVEAAERCGLPAAAISWPDLDCKRLFHGESVDAIAECDLSEILRDAHALANSGQFHGVWELCARAFALNIAAL